MSTCVAREGGTGAKPIFEKLLHRRQEHKRKRPRRRHKQIVQTQDLKSKLQCRMQCDRTTAGEKRQRTHTHTTVRPPSAAAACCRGPRGGRHKPCRSHRRVYGVFLCTVHYVCICVCMDVCPAGLQIPRAGGRISSQEHQTMMLACRSSSSSSSSDSDSGRVQTVSALARGKSIRQRSKIERHQEGQTYIHTYRTWGTTNTYKTTYIVYIHTYIHTLTRTGGPYIPTPTSRDLRGELDNRHQNKDLVYLGASWGSGHTEQQAGQAARFEGGPGSCNAHRQYAALPCMCVCMYVLWAGFGQQQQYPAPLSQPPQHIHTYPYRQTPHTHAHTYTPHTQSVTATSRHLPRRTVTEVWAGLGWAGTELAG